MQILRCALMVGIGLAVAAHARAQSSAEAPLSALQTRAQGGDPKAQNSLGTRYQTGDGVEKNAVEAVEWYRRAAKQGYAVAYYNLGTAYYNGEGIAANENAACKWFFLAADAGDSSGKEAFAREKQDRETLGGSNCEVLAGDAYLKGEEIPKDEKRAVALYQHAAAENNSFADLRLFSVYAEGTGVAPDMNEAMRWLKESADRKNARALYVLGRVYESGNGLASPDLRGACVNYRAAGLAGIPEAYTALGKMLDEGRGVKRRPEQALYYFALAQSGGDVSAGPLADKVKSELSKKDLQKMELELRQINLSYNNPCK